MGSSQKYQKTVLDSLPCTLPTRHIPDDIDPSSISHIFSDKLADLGDNDFTDDAIWRDTFSLSGTLRTFYSSKVILPIWRLLCQERKTANFKLKPETALVNRKEEGVAWVEVTFTFSMGLPLQALIRGYLCLVPDGGEGEWKIWVMGTILDQLPEFGDVDRLDPVNLSTTNSHSTEAAGAYQQTSQQHYDCVIVGGGQSGLCTTGRLQTLGVSYICIDGNNEVGDSWRLRYDSSKSISYFSVLVRLLTNAY